MIPRFSNPHFISKSFETVPRAELYCDDDIDISYTYDEAAVSELNQLLAQSIGVIQYKSKSESDDGQRNKKRRRVESVVEAEGIAEIEPEERPLFRLVSSALPPLPVSLLPPPPPPPITREPDAEDNEFQAVVRRERAQIASIDGETILRQSKTIKLSTNGKSHAINLHKKLGNSSSPVMIVRTTQTPRKTRPPVESSELVRYPYNSDISTLAIEPIKSRTMDCSTVDVESTHSDASTTRRRSRRRRKANSRDRKHPVPQFWRPSSSLEGKCRGYAYGYPSYLAAATRSLRVKYSRDRMKSGVHIDSI